MLKNEIINRDGTNWLVREATSREAADSAITMARVTGSVGSKHRETNNGVTTASADVVRLNDDGTEALPYGAKGGTDHSALVALAQSRAKVDHLDRALDQALRRNRIRAGALNELVGLATGDLPIHHDAAFLRSEILRITAEAKNTIAAAKAEAQGEAPAPTPDAGKLH